MIITFSWQGSSFRFDLSKPVYINLSLFHGPNNPNAWHAPNPLFEPHIDGKFIGSIAAGSPVNFFNVKINPHGNGTHTECLGHIADDIPSINQTLNNTHFVARLISVNPLETGSGDRVILPDHFEAACPEPMPEALILRTLPNSPAKKTMQYSGNNPPYLVSEAAAWLAQKGIDHFLTDLPSIDKEKDDGKLAAHKNFWQYPENPRLNATITEMTFIPEEVKDGLYLINIQIAPFEMDTSPSRVALYEPIFI